MEMKPKQLAVCLPGTLNLEFLQIRELSRIAIGIQAMHSITILRPTTQSQCIFFHSLEISSLPTEQFYDYILLFDFGQSRLTK